MSDWWARLHEPCPYPAGTRIRLVSMRDDPCPIEAGAEGTITGGNGHQLYLDWDNGRSLMLLVGVDEYEVL